MKLPNRTLVLAASLLLFVSNAFAQNWAAQAPPYGRPDATVRGDEVPGGHPLFLFHPRKQPVSLLGLERDRTDPPLPVPGQDLGQGPPAEAAVLVVQQHRSPVRHVMPFHLLHDPKGAAEWPSPLPVGPFHTRRAATTKGTSMAGAITS